MNRLTRIVDGRETRKLSLSLFYPCTSAAPSFPAIFFCQQQSTVCYSCSNFTKRREQTNWIFIASSQYQAHSKPQALTGAPDFLSFVDWKTTFFSVLHSLSTEVWASDWMVSWQWLRGHKEDLEMFRCVCKTQMKCQLEDTNERANMAGIPSGPLKSICFSVLCSCSLGTDCSCLFICLSVCLNVATFLYFFQW